MKDEHYSGVTARFQLASVDNVPATVTFTANVAFWKEAARNLEGEGYGAWQVRADLREVVRKAEAEFYERVVEERSEREGKNPST